MCKLEFDEEVKQGIYKECLQVEPSPLIWGWLLVESWLYMYRVI